MLDFILGIGLASLAVRGWAKGLVRQILDLGAFIAGVWVAFRLSGPLGDLLSDRFGVGPEAARVGAGIALFLLLGLAAGVAASFLARVTSLPGLNLGNRVGGAAVAAALGIAILLGVVVLARALPLPEGIEDALDGSVVVESIAGQDSWPRRAFGFVTGDDLFYTLGRLRDAVGEARVVPEGDESVPIESAPRDELGIEEEQARFLLRRLNEDRQAEGARPLLWSEGLAVIAAVWGIEMYEVGELSRVSATGVTVEDRVAGAGIRLVASGANLALAATTRSAHAGIVESETGKELSFSSRFDRAGVAVIDGPHGLLVVVILGG